MFPSDFMEMWNNIGDKMEPVKPLKERPWGWAAVTQHLFLESVSQVRVEPPRHSVPCSQPSQPPPNDNVFDGTEHNWEVQENQQDHIFLVILPMEVFSHGDQGCFHPIFLALGSFSVWHDNIGPPEACISFIIGSASTS